MSDPGFARPDLCSIRTAGGQEELAEAVRGGSAPMAVHRALMTRPHTGRARHTVRMMRAARGYS